MLKLIPFLFLLFTCWSAASNSLSEIKEWRVKDGAINARIVYLSADKKIVFYAGVDDIIKKKPLALFEEADAEKIKKLDKEDTRMHSSGGRDLIIPYRNAKLSANHPETWPPTPAKGWQIRNWEVNRNGLKGIHPNDYGDRNAQTEINISAAVWWHTNFTFRHTEAKDHEKLLKILYKKFRNYTKATTTDFAPKEAAGKYDVMIHHYYKIKPVEFDQFLTGNCVTGIYMKPYEGSRGYRDDFLLLKKAQQKGSYILYHWGEQVTGHFVLKKTKKGEPEEYIFEYDDLKAVPEWFINRDKKLHYQGIVRTMIPLERQAEGVKWLPHPNTKVVEKAAEQKPVADSVVLPDNEIKFLDKQQPLTMEITNKENKSMIATLNKAEQGQIQIRKRNSTHTLTTDSLDFETQMKVNFWKANQGVKYKLPACRLHYKVRSVKRGYGYRFTICYDGESRCYLTTENHKEEVYFNSEKFTYSIYKSENGRLLLKEKGPYDSEKILQYPTLSHIGNNRKNYPLTSASDTKGFANRIIKSKSTTIDNYHDINELKAAHVEAQPVLQFIHGFSSINVPATQTISRANYSLMSSMRLLFENATLPTELQWMQIRHKFSRGRNRSVKELMELSLDKISPLEDNFFHQFEKLEADQEAQEKKIRKANAQ